MTEPISNYSWPPHFSGQPPPPQLPPPNPADKPVLVAGNLTTSRDNNLNPEGRVSKPIRRRTRASRRTPTTLLSTDTRNFRAMVQQFTGGPSVSLAPFMSQNQILTPASATSAPIDAGYYQLLQQNRRAATAVDDQNFQMFSFAGNRGGGDGGIDRNYQDSGEMGRINLAGTSGFFMEDLISHHAPPHPPSSN